MNSVSCEHSSLIPQEKKGPPPPDEGPQGGPEKRPPDEGIIIEDKTDTENHTTHEFQPNEIFKASDVMVDALTKLLDSERNKRKIS